MRLHWLAKTIYVTIDRAVSLNPLAAKMANSLFPAFSQSWALPCRHCGLGLVGSAPQELAQIVCHCKCAKCLHLFTTLCVSFSLTLHLSLCMCKIIILQWHDVKWPTLETWTCSAAPEARPQRNVPLTQPSRVAHAMGLPVVTYPHPAHRPPCGDSKASYLIIIMRTKFMMRIFMYYSQS